MNIEVFRPQLTEYQKRFLYNDARFTVVEAATKCGKTYSHLWWLFECAMQQGKPGAAYWWVAPVYTQAEIAFNRMRRVVSKHKAFNVSITGLSITCPNGAVIYFKSAERPDNLYGEDVYACVFDEFTRAREEAFHALRSTLTGTAGKMKLIGNARGKKNWGYRLGAKARAGEPGYAYFKVTAYDAHNAGLKTKDGRSLEEEIEQAKRDLPARVFNELYMAEPQEDGSNPFGYEYIAACVKPKSDQQAVHFGVDLAKRTDYTVIVGLDRQGHISYFNRFRKDWEQTTAEVAKAIGQQHALIDSTGVGDPIVERVQKLCRQARGLNYSSGTATKQQLMEGLAVSLHSGEIGIIDGILREELEAFEFTYTDTGVKYNAPDGFTDDCVNALALANRCRLFYPFIKRHKSMVL